MRKHSVTAKWEAKEGRYVIDPSDTDCDCDGTSGTSGWYSEDGNDWLDFGGGVPAGDFETISICLSGGPRDGEVVC